MSTARAASLRSAEECLSLADAVLARVAAGTAAEVTVVEQDSALTRFADNAIHQNVAEVGLRLRLRLVRDDRAGVAEVRGDSREAIVRLVAAAEDARRLAPAGTAAALPAPDGGADFPVAYDASTAAASPERMADDVGVVTSAATSHGLRASGAHSASTVQVAIANTRGIRRTARTTRASLLVVGIGEDGSGYAARHAAGLDSIDAAGLAAEVVDTTLRNQGAEPLDPGVYEVVLAPYAVADMLEYLSWMGFGALAVQEERSFMRPGERLVGESLTIRDDPAHPDLQPFPFDWEGVSSHTVTFIDHGVCRDVVYDTPTALVDGARSTGHALPMPNTIGPVATHLLIEPGDLSHDALIPAMRRGLYVTRFWYVREVHVRRTVITGMTREGTFLVENGRIVRPVRDLRFTQSIVDALATVRGVSRERSLQTTEDGTGVLAPWLHLGEFAFTS